MTQALTIGNLERDLQYSGSYYDVALQVRELLSADFSAVATVQSSSLVIRAVAGRGIDGINDLTQQLVTLGPIVLDDARVICVPAIRDNRVSAILIGYSTAPGRFTGRDLERLIRYGEGVAVTLDASHADAALREALLSPDEVQHVSRLVTIGKLAACFAHDVFNPLTMIRGHLRMVEETLQDGDPMRSSFEVIDKASRRIEDMARRMLDFSRKRAGERTNCMVDAIITDAVRFVQPYLRAQRVHVQILVEPPDVFVRADRVQMLQVLVNLIHNAADAMTNCPQRELRLSARGGEGRLQIDVSDTGRGIPPDQTRRIFSPFFSTKGENGTGLGLYIARRAVEEHGGHIFLQTSERGTTFTIMLPLD